MAGMSGRAGSWYSAVPISTTEDSAPTGSRPPGSARGAHRDIGALA